MSKSLEEMDVPSATYEAESAPRPLSNLGGPSTPQAQPMDTGTSTSHPPSPPMTPRPYLMSDMTIGEIVTAIANPRSPHRQPTSRLESPIFSDARGEHACNYESSFLSLSHILPSAQLCNIILNRVIHLHIVYFHYSCRLSERASGVSFCILFGLSILPGV